MPDLKIIILLFLIFLLAFALLYEKTALKELFGITLIVESSCLGGSVHKIEAPMTASKSIFFVGDIMLDRGVEMRMKKHGFVYPFEKISSFLNDGDIVFGNLEGPIVKNPTHFPDASLKFAFSLDAIQGLSYAGFNVLSLANNHTSNMGTEGLIQTRKFLEEAGIKAVGDPVLCEKSFLTEDQDIIFLAFNKTFSFNCSDKEIASVVEETSRAYPEKPLIISFHWGEEYQNTSSSAQKKLAHLVIDAGADLIIGHHPHIVQEIEEYGGKMIFYSLGNFIFDQDFSAETRQGLVVKLKIESNTLVYELFPVQINSSQPLLMGNEESGEFLRSLAERSDYRLEIGIKNGRIEKIWQQ